MKETCSKCSARKTERSDKLKTDIDKRLARIEGQIKGVRKMVLEDVYCDNVLNQVTSIQAALNGVRMLLLENHLKSCVLDQIKEGQIEVIDELVQTISRMTRQ